jgi:very-short-patch-repair endonuclease
VTVGCNRRPSPASRDAKLIGLGEIKIRRRSDAGGRSVSARDGIPTTNPLRTLVDLAGEVPVGTLDDSTLDEALDVALARRLVTVEALQAELRRLQRPGRRGPKQLRAQLRKRALAGAPSPSVLESRALRLMRRHHLPVAGYEVVVDEGRYRVDMQVDTNLVVEVDGYAFHWSPEHKGYDDARRNRLRLLGFQVLVYDWRTVTSEPLRMVREIRAARRLLAQGLA